MDPTTAPRFGAEEWNSTSSEEFFFFCGEILKVNLNSCEEI
jgi:hypothetical protein